MPDPAFKRFQRKTLLISESFPPSIGGIQNYLAGLWSHIPPETTAVIASAQENSDTWDTEQPYRIIRTPMQRFGYPRWRPALRVLRSAVRSHRPDAIVCGKALFEGRAARVIFREQHIPYIVLTHALEIRTWMEHRKTRHDLMRVLTDASRVVCVNDEIKTLLQNQGIPEKKMVKMYPGISDQYIDFDLSKVRKNTQPSIVTMCRLVSRKGVDVVLNALPQVREKVPNIRYVIIGDGPERERLESLTRTLDISDAVQFTGALPNEELIPKLAECDLFVMTPREESADIEGFGIVYIEAAALSLPSVASKTGGVPEAVRDGITGVLVSPDNPEQTATAIIRLLQNSSERVRLGENARKRAVYDFRWSRRALLFRGMIEAVALEHERA